MNHIHIFSPLKKVNMIMNMMKYHQMRKLQTKIQHQRFSEFCCLFITCNFCDVIKFVLYFALFSIKISDLPPGRGLSQKSDGMLIGKFKLNP